MKKIAFFSLLLISILNLAAQDSFKTGAETTLVIKGQFITEAQTTFADGKPSSILKSYWEINGDSLLVHIASVYPNRENQKVFRYSIAKKDIDKGDWGVEVEKTIENGTSFWLVKIKSNDQESLISEQEHSHDEIEAFDPTNRIHIYFPVDKESDARAFMQKIQTVIK